MRDKRGLSSIVSTILIIVIILVILGVAGAIVMNLIGKTAGQISASKYTVSVNIVSAKINFSTGIASIRVGRDLGMGEMVGLKFIFQDETSSEAYDIRVVGFDELEERTFDIDLEAISSNLSLYGLQKVYVSPVILLESGDEVIGTPSEIISNLQRWLNGSIGYSGETKDPGGICFLNSDCGTDYFIDGTRYCLENLVHQYMKMYNCTLGFCDESLEDVIVEECSNECYDGVCTGGVFVCSPENVTTDCGVDGLIGIPVCSPDGTAILQDYKSYACVNGSCEVTISAQTIETCNESEVCFNAECFVPLECTTHDDCDPGEICVEGICEIEAYVNNGIVNSVWPFGIGEYFDSSDLLNPENKSLVNYFTFFFGSAQTSCLKITEHLMPNATGASPYVRLNESITNISSGDSFQVWETNYICG